ncbi:MAG TPA: hypothetical protein VFF04_01815 [Candidatus Babeliales bacterium]|nr:hypothetical protein [Candidatus Babeliales bacterium]
MNKNIAVLMITLATINVFAADPKEEKKDRKLVGRAINEFLKKTVKDERQLRMIPVINPKDKDKSYTAFTLLNGDMIYHSRAAAEQDGFTFNEKNEFGPFEVVLAHRGKEQYSWAIVLGAVHGVPVLQIAQNTGKGVIKKNIGKYNSAATKVGE